MKNLILNLSKKARIERAAVFLQNFTLKADTKIVDLGSENGVNINSILQNTAVKPQNVYIADIAFVTDLKDGGERFGYNAVLLNETEKLPFPDKFFDIVYCSSVIEHVTVPKKEIWDHIPGRDFHRISREQQKKFAEEITRIGKQYFVQTPNRNFIIESHTWLPFFGYLPRYWMVKLMRIVNKIWIKPSIPDYDLLNCKEMASLFPDAEMVYERKFGMIKSIMAIKTER